MSNDTKRIMGYEFARELSRAELEAVSGGLQAETKTRVTTGDDKHTTTDSDNGDH